MSKRLKDFIFKTVVDLGKHPYDINCGECEEFAIRIQEKFPKVEVLWGDQIPDKFPKRLVDNDEIAYHCFIRLKGKYYDAEEPGGVSKPHFLPLYQRLINA